MRIHEYFVLQLQCNLNRKRVQHIGNRALQYNYASSSVSYCQTVWVQARKLVGPNFGPILLSADEKKRRLHVKS